MNDRERVRTSKFLSLVLRHAPESVGLTLGPGGWVEIDRLLAAAAGVGRTVTREQLDLVVSACEKQRFAIDETGSRIRANQGHSTEVDLELLVAVPPTVLYHGTGSKSVVSIRATGLNRMARHHVHLSADVETATRVGSRHGVPVVFVVDAGAMAADGRIFYRSANGVWLVDDVPPRYLTILPGDPE